MSLDDDVAEKIAEASHVLNSIHGSGAVMTDEELQGRLSTAINHLEDAKERIDDE